MLCGRLAELENKTRQLWGHSPPGLICCSCSRRHLHFPKLKHASNFETVLSNFPPWNTAPCLRVRLGTQNHKHFGKGKLSHSIAFATLFPVPMGKTLPCRFTMWDNRQSVRAGPLFILSYVIIQNPTVYFSLLKTISLDMKYMLPGSPPSQFTASHSLSFFFWGEREENVFSGYIAGSAHEPAIYFLLDLTLPGP